MHPGQVIVGRIDRRRVWREAELLAVRPEIIIEGVVLFWDDQRVFSWHRNLPARCAYVRADPHIIYYKTRLYRSYQR